MSGILITLTGHCQPFLTAGGILSVVGAALVYTLDIDSSAGEYLGYQAIMGAGVGLCIQVPVIAAQAFCDPADIAPATAIVLCEFSAPHIAVSSFSLCACIYPSISNLRISQINPITPYSSLPNYRRRPLRLCR